MTYDPGATGYFTASYDVGVYTNAQIIASLVGKMQVEHDYYANNYYRIEYIGVVSYYGTDFWTFKCYRG